MTQEVREFTREAHQRLTKADFISAALSMKGNIVVHFKGDKYLILDVALNSHKEDEVYVVYKALYGECKVYIRELFDFFDWVADREDNVMKNKMRFEPIIVTSEKERRAHGKKKNNYC